MNAIKDHKPLFRERRKGKASRAIEDMCLDSEMSTLVFEELQNVTRTGTLVDKSKNGTRTS